MNDNTAWRYFVRAALGVALLYPHQGRAQAIDASYHYTIAGISIGRANVSGKLEIDKYNIEIVGEISLLGISRNFQGSSHGLMRNRRLIPSRYSSKIGGRNGRSVTVDFAEDRTASVTIEPRPPAEDYEGIIPIELAHMKEVIDPLSDLLNRSVRVTDASGLCAGTSRIFAGNIRFDLSFEAKVTTPTEITCRATLLPVSGHKSTSERKPTDIIISYPRNVRPGELNLPRRIEAPLPLGTLIISRTN